MKTSGEADFSSSEEEKKRLLSEIENRSRFDKKWQDANYHFAQYSRWIAVISSTFAAVAVKIGKFPPWIVAILAAIPAFAILIERIFPFYQRSQWHGTEFLQLQELIHKLRFQNASAKEVSEQFCKIRKELEPRYPAFGAFQLRIGEKT